MGRLTIWMALILLGVPNFLKASTITVPGDAPDLKTAVELAQNGDVIALGTDLKGELNKNIVVDKDIVVDGQGHSIDLEGDGRAFDLSANVVIRFLKISNGDVGLSSGGAVLARFGDVQLEGCLFIHSTASWGGAVNMSGSPDNPSRLTVTNCVFEGNLATQYGGGLAFYGDSDELQKAVISKSVFKDNLAGTGYAAFGLSHHASIEITGTRIEKNVSGIYVGSGGAPFEILDTSEVIFENNIIARNVAGAFPGGRFEGGEWGGTTTYHIRNNTWIDNESWFGWCVGQISVVNDSTVDPMTVVANNIIWSEHLTESPAIWADSMLGSEGWTMSRNCLSGPELDNSVTDIYKNPLLNAKYSPTWQSPCLDSGDGDQIVLTDFYGKTRFDLPQITNTGLGDPDYGDIGAIEVVNRKYYQKVTLSVITK